LTLGFSKLTVEAKSWRFWNEPYASRAILCLAVFATLTRGVLSYIYRAQKAVASRSSPSVTREPSNVGTIGGAIMLYFNDASICVATCGNPSVPWKLVDTDVANSFHHTFFLGLVNPGSFNMD